MANILKQNDILHAQYGDVRVMHRVGGGSQGDIYAVEYNGRKMALKWYRNDIQQLQPELLGILRLNISRGAPTKAFIWPVDLVDVTDEGNFGYLMEFIPDGYYEAGELFLRGGLFPSFGRIIDACLNVTHAFNILHNAGYVYRDISGGNFFINPNTGDVLICDNDNVAPGNVDLGIRGTPRYMAPEIVATHCPPTERTDLHSLALIIFNLLHMQHPLEGKRADIMDQSNLMRIYGTDPLFIFDKNDHSNAPHPQTAQNAIGVWSILPAHMRQMFQRAFSREALLEGRRPTEIEWIRELARLRSELVVCPRCGSQVFMQDALPVTCDNPACKQRICATLRFELPISGYSLPLVDDTRIYTCQAVLVPDSTHARDPLLWVRESQSAPGTFAIQNVSSGVLRVRIDGGNYDISPGQMIKAWEGMELMPPNSSSSARSLTGSLFTEPIIIRHAIKEV